VKLLLARTACYVFLVVASSRAAAAQDDSLCSFDTMAHIRIDTVTIGLAAGWDRTARKKSPDDYLVAALVIQSHFRPPERVRLPLWARTKGRSDSIADRSEYIGYGLDTDIQFWLSDNGRLASARVELNGASQEIVASIIDAIVRADSAREFQPPGRDVRRAKGAIQLRLVDAPHTQPPGVSLLRVQIPALVIDSAPSLLWMPPLEYPPIARLGRIGDRVILELVIRADGRPDTASIGILQASYREFAVEALTRVKEARFRPAKVAGCPVPVLVRLPFDFRVRR
jgi:TonB family protein